MSWSDSRDNRSCWVCGRLESNFGLRYWKDVPDRLICSYCGDQFVNLLKNEKEMLAKLGKDEYRLFNLYKKRGDDLLEIFYYDLDYSQKAFFSKEDYSLILKKLDVKQKKVFFKFFRTCKAIERDFRDLKYQHETLKATRKSARDTWMKKIDVLSKRVKFLEKQNVLIRKKGMKPILDLEEKEKAKVLKDQENELVLVEAKKKAEDDKFRKAGLIPCEVVKFEEKLKGVIVNDASKKC